MKNILRVAIVVLFLAQLSQLYAQTPACPAVNTSPNVVIPCGQTCTTLSATAFGGAKTTAYTVNSIPYNPVSYTAGTPIVEDTIDDVFSNVINLPFNFCFFGQVYNSMIVSTNGYVSFNTTNAGLFSNWYIPGPLPSPVAPNDVYNSIMAPWQDLDPTYQGKIYFDTGGVAPCRYVSVSWYRVPMFGDPNSSNTSFCTVGLFQVQQLVFYETTNIIDINIQSKQSLCEDSIKNDYWNNDWAVEGIINASGTTAYIVPGRNAGTVWDATNDAYRFTPSGAPDYTLTWFHGLSIVGTGDTVTVCPGGSTTYTASAAYTNCDNTVVTVTANVNVSLDNLTVNIDSIHQPTCAGNNGAVYASFSGGSGTVTYGWSPGGAGQTQLTNIGAGTYIFSATDTSGCTKSDTVVLTLPNPPSVTVANDTVTSCEATITSGSLTAQATGGSGSYTYLWSTTQTTQTVTGLNAGTYSVVVTDSLSCTASATGTVVEIQSHISVGLSQVSPISCSGASNGSIAATVTGGTAPYSYSWSFGSSTADTLSGLALGLYNVTVTDINGCSASASYLLREPAPVLFSSPILNSPTCSYSTDGSIIVSAGGGTGNITYSWSNGETGDTATGLGAGTYTVIASDQNGCADTTTYTLTAPAPIVFGPAQLQNPLCNGDANGSIIVSATGGTGPITYSWTPSSNGDTLTGLSSGTYSVTATDSVGCSASTTYTLSSPPAIVIDSATLVSPTCSYSSDGSITVFASGGTGTLNYLWSIGQTTSTITGLGSRTYDIIVTDSNGCSASASYDLTAPAAITFGAPVITPAACGASTGSITVSATGGTGTITYSWNPAATGASITGLGAGTYTVTATDSVGCSATATYNVTATASLLFGAPVLTNPACNGGSNGSIVVSVTGGTGTITYSWSPSGSGDSLGGLNAGTYTVTATDSLGCSATAQYSLTNPSPITFGTATLNNPGCSGADGSITVSASGGTGTITYSWNIPATGATVTGLGTGSYTVTATDSLGCTATATYTLTGTSPITFGAPIIQSPVCHYSTDGGIIVSATGGSGNITYTWSPSGTGDTLTGLGVGTYTVTATDTTGCSATASYTINSVSNLSFGPANIQNPSCGGGNNGSITVQTGGGVGTVNYTWNPAATGASITGLGGGVYSVTATDSLGCSATAQFTLTPGGALTITNAALVNPTCSNTSDGSITLTVSGASGIPTYTWSPSGTGNPLTGLTGGTYSVTVEDTTGCSTTASYTLTQPTAVVIDTAVVNSAGCGGTNNGSISVTASGGTGALSYHWGGGQTTSTITGLAGGTYTVTVSDANGCSTSASYNVGQSTGVTFGTPAVVNASCRSGSGGSITITATGTGTVTYLWSTGATTATITGLASGTYCVTATDSVGCSANTCVNITQGSPLVIDSGSVNPVQCGGTVGSITLTVTGGTPPYTYSWSGGLTGNPLDSLQPGGYSVTVTDTSGCSATAYFIVGHASCGGCPAINTDNNVAIPCSQSCTTLTATAFSAATTDAYTVAPIPYNPPYAFDAGTPVLVHTDDLWSSVINLPFNFCFFGVPNSQIIVGSNGVIGFNVSYANTFNSWQIPGPIPDPTPADVTNSIMTPWQDLDPTNQGSIYYQITGTAPCRQFEVSWYRCAMYGDPNSVDASGFCTIPTYQSQQVVLYETTNAIDINIQSKAVICNNVSGTYWNNGWAIEGIQNAAGSIAYTVPGRNATQWTAANDAWRFTPAGAPDYTIEWFHGTDSLGSGNNLLVCPDTATTYRVVATYTNCDASTVVVADSVFVTPGGDLQISIDSVHQPTCSGLNGAVYASFTTSSTVTSFGWSPGGADLTSLTNIGPGTYIFTVTTLTGCSKSDTVTLVGPPALNVTVNNDTISVCDSSSGPGSLTAIVTGGTPSYNYIWSNLATTQTIGGISSPGTYSVTVTDSSSCSATASGSIILLPASTITFDSAIITNVSCGGGSNGSIIVSTTGGTPPIIYTWSGGLPNDSIQTGLGAGTYTVTATDRYGCSASAQYTITQPTPIVFGPPVYDTITCNGGTGCIIVSASGGTGPITYSWTSGNTSDSACGLVAGSYTVTATDSTGCTATATYSLSQPPAIHIDSVAIVAPTCTVGGSLQVFASGGTGTLTYVWSNGDTGDSIGGLAAGPYGLTITDANGCSITATLTDTASSNVLHFGPPILSQPHCFGDSSGCIEAVVLGGTPPYQYLWNNGDTTAINCGLAAGSYSITVTDSAGCSASITYILGQPQPVVLNTPTIDSISCFGGTNGSITANASGGTPPYTYTWDSTTTGQTLSGLGIGTYCVVVTDSFGCSASACYTLTQPTPIVVDTIISTQATCTSGGTLTVTASGGTPPYTYSWPGGFVGNPDTGLAAGTYTVTVTDHNGCSVTASDTVGQAPGAVFIGPDTITNITCFGDSTGSITITASDSGVGGPITFKWANGDTTATITGLVAGTYCVTVTDSLGCTATACYTVSQPAAIVFGSPVFTPITCFGDSNGCITVTATGGTGAITYVWGGGSTGDSICGLAAGTYSVTATDSAGCTASTTINLGQPTPVVLNLSVSNITCNGANNGSITANTSGGTGSFTYIWSNGATTDSITGLSVGYYCVTATDSAGCSASACDSITQPPLLVIDSVTSTQVTCTTLGSVTVYAEGGTGALSYTWSNGATTATVTGLTAGLYCVTVSDANGCSATACDSVTNSPALIVIDAAVITPVTCTTLGSVTLTVTGGTGTLTYSWTPSEPDASSITGLSAGTYSVTVSDSTGCSATGTYNVPDSSQTVTITGASISQITCNNANNGSITVTAIGGNGTIVYNWSTGQTGATITGLSAGTYCVTASSAGCVDSACYTIINPPLLVIDTAFVTPITCSASGSINVVATGGTPPLSYSWTGGSTTNPLTVTTAGTYCVTVTDSSGCTASNCYNVANNGGALTFNQVTVVNELCNGGSTGSITVSVSGGTGVIYTWSTGATGASISSLSVGTYCVTASDTAGCSADTCVNITAPQAITYNTQTVPVGCTGLGNGSIIASGGTGILHYRWSNGATTSVDTVTTPGTYSFTITDDNGCTQTGSVNVPGGGHLTLNVNVHNVGCTGSGSIAVIATGGTGGYNYNWSPTEPNTDSISGLAVGTYCVTVTDGGGCSADTCVSVQHATSLTVAISAPPICKTTTYFDTATTVITGGVGPYSYRWSNGATTAVDTFQGGPASVIVTDASGCTAQAFTTVRQDNPTYNNTYVNGTCADQIITVTIAGQSAYPPFVYTLDSGSTQIGTNTTGVFDSLTPGTYTFIILDSINCPVRDSFPVHSYLITSIRDSIDSASCPGVNDGEVILYPNDTSQGPFTYSLNGVSQGTDSAFTELAPGSYTFEVINRSGCPYTTPALVVPSKSVPAVTLLDTLWVVRDDSTTLPDSALALAEFNNPVFSWTPATGLSCTNCEFPTITITTPTVYHLTVSDSAQTLCNASDSIVVLIEGGIVMPNAFTPNGDGVNDKFGPVHFSYGVIKEFHIYNRWGELVYSGTDYWDGTFKGKEQPAGTYVYYIEFQYQGNPSDPNYHPSEPGGTVTYKKEGAVTLLR